MARRSENTMSRRSGYKLLKLLSSCRVFTWYLETRLDVLKIFRRKYNGGRGRERKYKNGPQEWL